MLCLLLLPSCSELGTSVLVEGTWSQPECELGEVTWRPTFATWTRNVQGTAVMRIQTDAGPLDGDDHVVIAFRDPASIPGRVGEPIRIGPRELGDSAFGTLNFHERCPDARRSSSELIGTLVFEEFTGKLESDVRGHADVMARDARDPDLVYSEEIRIEFAFRIRRFPPYQPFNAGF
ncbi:MAG: hypothetical protein EA398_09745 [Deltaproteobacteria bacterium]|nr:MAG: hypothetical protein EA398_09745 [Deltaproteobacteria bacterium]